MERKIIFLLVLLLPLINAIPVLELQHNQTQPGETILAKIATTGEFADKIRESQIKFFEGRKSIELEKEIQFYNSTYYLSIYTTKEQNLTIQIENILYKENDILQSATIKQNLTIQKDILFNEDTNESYIQILKVKPGLVFTASSPKIKLTNLGTYTINATFKKNEVSISPLESEEIEFIPSETFSQVTISTYKDFTIPIIYLANNQNKTNKTPEVEPILKTNTSLIFLELFTGNTNQTTIQLFNFGNENITNIETSYNISFLEIEKIENMGPKEIRNITLEFNPETSGHFQGIINISYSVNETKNILEVPFSIFVLPEGTPEENFEISEKTCQQISGQICPSGSICNGTSTFTKNLGNLEYCCLGSCIETKSKDSESSGFGWLIGIIILAILAYIVYYFYKKQKSLKTPTSSDAIQSKSKTFENRLSGISSQKTKGNLTKS